jgi:hypothetical protein
MSILFLDRSIHANTSCDADQSIRSLSLTIACLGEYENHGSGSVASSLAIVTTIKQYRRVAASIIAGFGSTGFGKSAPPLR